MKDIEKKITIKSYLILAAIFILTIFLTIYLCKCYQVYSESMKEIPVIRGTLSEITSEELEHYVQENPNCVVYVCTASDQRCREYEEKFKKLIKKQNLQEEIVYLNVSNVEQEEFIKSFNDTYKHKVELNSNYPAILLFEDKAISSILQEKDSELSITKTKNFIELNNIGE